MSKRRHEATPTIDAAIEQDAKRLRTSLEADAAKGVLSETLHVDGPRAMEIAVRAIEMESYRPIPFTKIHWHTDVGRSEKQMGDVDEDKPESTRRHTREEKVQHMRLSFEVAASNGFTSLVLQTDSHEQIRTSWEAIEMRTACATANTSPMTSAVYPRVKAVTAAFGNTGRMPFAATKMALSIKLAMPG